MALLHVLIYLIPLTKLQTYSKEHDVFEVIKTEQTEIENYHIDSNAYDYIVAVSSLEHVKSKEDFKKCSIL